MSFDGSQLSFLVAAPSLTNPISKVANFTVSSAVEIRSTAALDKPGDFWSVVNAKFNFSAGKIAYKILHPTDGRFGFGLFNGYVIEDKTGSLRPIVDVAIIQSHNTIELTKARVSYNSETIKINVSGLSFDKGDSFVLDVAFGGNGSSGNNTLKGGNARDWLHGKAGNDILSGYGANDKLYGEAGNDRLSGGDGRDYLSGGDGTDVLHGGTGNDVILGGPGGDHLFGDTGTDTFYFTHYKDTGATDATRDVIYDLVDGEKINLSAIDANALTSTNEAFVIDTDGSFSAGEIALVIQGNDTLIKINRDNGPLAELEILVKNRTDLDAGDFVL